ncbi:hypothetical protein ABZ281_23600 [Streptomyces sp. NPDC006265]|uniref:hypothetical protein n=1 Tax=Streptomyces sp. NPDC006265 TaxID=3156740 RepID=UPI0033A9F808
MDIHALLPWADFERGRCGYEERSGVPSRRAWPIGLDTAFMTAPPSYWRACARHFLTHSVRQETGADHRHGLS